MEEHTITTNPDNKNKLSKTIIKTCIDLGFDDCAICKAEFFENDKHQYSNWLKKKFHADMHYLENNLDKRFNPKLLFENAKSVVVVLKNYYSRDKLKDKNLYISKYALGKDYHKVIKNKLRKVLEKLKKNHNKLNGKIFVDTAPILERSNAVKAGLGFIGKNKCLINPQLGSFVFIGEIILDVELVYNENNIKQTCENCQLCVKKCPTGALSNYGLDANKCISYHTIENKKNIPPKIISKITNQIFGCDICQNVCPYNKNLKEHNEHDFKIYEEIKNISLKKLVQMTDIEFKEKYKDTVLLRAGRNKIIDNIKIVNEKQ